MCNFRPSNNICFYLFKFQLPHTEWKEINGSVNSAIKSMLKKLDK